MPAPDLPGLLDAYGWSDRVAGLWSTEAADPDVLPARVLRVDRDRCLVVTPTGEATATASPLPATGDWVVIGAPTEDREPVPIVAVLPAWSRLVRHGAGETTTAQVLAANADLIFITVGLDRELNQSRLDRELAVAWDSGARPVVVLTKADALPDPEAAAATVADGVVGVDVVLTSSLDGRGVDAVRALLGPHDTAVLLGASGVGKSTLANRLLGTERLATGEVRANDHKGRHTTTARHLEPLPGGGVLIDTPGIRGMGLWDGDEGITLAFPDVEALVGQCRFRDCAHDAEPGCAITAATAAGTLAPQRLSSWNKLRREVERVERSRDARAQAEHRRKTRAFFKSLKGQQSRP